MAREQVLARMISPLFEYAAGPSPTEVIRVVGRLAEGATSGTAEVRVWQPQRPGDWEGRRGAGAGLALQTEEVTWLEFSLSAAAEDLVRAELWLAVWPEEGGEGQVEVLWETEGAELEVVATLTRRDGGYIAMQRADVSAVVREVVADGRPVLRLGLRRGEATAVAVAVDGADDPDPFEPQIFLFTARGAGAE
jgi:hypothetical protein